MSTRLTENFPFKSNYADIYESSIHYIDENEFQESETVFLFLHGNPTSSFLWRNIIPHLKSLGRCVAPDLIGFGKSGKPAIDYTFDDHYRYMEAFIEKLNLRNIILVVHDWGGAIGFHYARKHPKKITGIVFMETFYKPMEWENLDPFARWLFRRFRDPICGERLNGKLNLFLRFILPFSMYQKLSASEKKAYTAPFHAPQSRKPIVMFPQELPFQGSGTKNEEIANDYFKWLQRSNIPKLLLYAKPGVQITGKQVDELQSNLINITVKYVGKGKHFIQEDQPDTIGKEIVRWYRGL